MSATDALEALVSGVPDVDEFPTVAELERDTLELAAAHPREVSLMELGRTRRGRPLRCLRVGRGGRVAVALGAPHPNEPVGVVTLTYLAHRLAEEPDLADELGYTWYVVKAWDADGLALNEGWLKGPFTLHGYARHYYRPPFPEQPDWTFPVSHGTLRFDSPTPEAACAMRLMDEVRPDLLLSLHNCSFGGAYWYETEPTPEIWDRLRAAASGRGIPLNLSTPEMPYARRLAPAVFESLGAEAAYDYYASLGRADPAACVGHGTTGARWAARRHGTFSLTCEIPYFLDPAIGDVSGCGRSLEDVTLERLDAVDAVERRVADWTAELKGALGADNPYRSALETASFAASDAALRLQAQTDPAFRREASVAERFEALVVRPFYRSRNVGMLLSAIDLELAGGRLGAGAREAAERVSAEASAWLREACDGFERASSYEAIPVRDLVATQLESCLLAAAHVREARQGAR